MAEHTLTPTQSEALDIDDAGDDSTDDPDTCTETKTNGDICGRDRPCRYHD